MREFPQLHPENYPVLFATDVNRTDAIHDPQRGRDDPAQMVMLDVGEKNLYFRITDRDALKLIEQLAKGVASR